MLTALMTLTLARAASLDALLAEELDRAMAVYEAAEQPAYYAAVQVTDRDVLELAAREGAVDTDRRDHQRYLDVDLRVGTPELDSTHTLRGFSSLDADTRRPLRWPLEDDDLALRHGLWLELERSYREASERYVLVQANQRVKVAEERLAPDFEGPRGPLTAIEPVAPLVLDVAGWRQHLVAASEALDASPAVHRSQAHLQATRSQKTFADTDDRALTHGRLHYRVALSAATTAPDGDQVSVFEAWDAQSPERLPSREEVLDTARALVERLEALARAPRGQPYSGPVLLSGRAAGVFVHEVLGHRVEGHRQKREDEGRTFADHLGAPVLPSFLSIHDDPTVQRLAGHDLNGFYRFDDEGTPAARAPLVEAGIFRGFLLGRSPIPGFESSNGHARRSPGHAPGARMGNTLVEASAAVPRAELEEALRREAARQGLEYGLLVEDIEGGFTLTGRQMPNAFNVRASASYRIFVDGRPRELVRGIDLVGTPLVAFSEILAASEEVEVFNGQCGAESGWVPVSAVSPALLFRRLEFQLKEKGQERPPLLPKPSADGAADAEGGAP